VLGSWERHYGTLRKSSSEEETRTRFKSPVGPKSWEIIRSGVLHARTDMDLRICTHLRPDRPRERLRRDEGHRQIGG